jgi:hypothetical protein
MTTTKDKKFQIKNKEMVRRPSVRPSAPRFISFHFKQFFQQYNTLSLMEQLDNDIYQKLHLNLLHQLTRKERGERKPTISDSNQLAQQQNQQQQQDCNKKEIRISYTFESGPMSSFKKEFRHLWKKYLLYPGSPMNNATLNIGIQTNNKFYSD